jgi:hypothetical protein
VSRPQNTGLASASPPKPAVFTKALKRNKLLRKTGGAIEKPTKKPKLS